MSHTAQHNRRLAKLEAKGGRGGKSDRRAVLVRERDRLRQALDHEYERLVTHGDDATLEDWLARHMAGGQHKALDRFLKLDRMLEMPGDRQASERQASMLAAMSTAELEAWLAARCGQA